MHNQDQSISQANLKLLFFRQSGNNVFYLVVPLYFYGSPFRIQCSVKTGQNAITHRFETLAEVFFDQWPLEVTVFSGELKGALFIFTHRGGIANNFGEPA